MKKKILFVSLFFVLASNSCKSQINTENIIPLKIELLEKELSTQNNIIQDTIYIEYGLNNLLKEFIYKNTLEEELNLEFHDYRKCMTIKEQRDIFNKKEVENLISQINVSNSKIIYLIDFPEKSKFNFAPIKKVKNNFKNSAPLSTNIYFYVLSEPIITTNKEYAILAYSKGYVNSQSGGIKVFKKKNNSYEISCLLESWTE